MLSGFFTGNLSPPTSDLLSSTLELDPNTPEVDTDTINLNPSVNTPEQNIKHNIRYTGTFVTLTPPVTNPIPERYFEYDTDTESDTDTEDSNQPVTFKVLCDTNGLIEWMDTGITYRGDIQNDKIVFGKDNLPNGSFTVPENTRVSYRGGKGVLTFNDTTKEWNLSFNDVCDAPSFYIRSITSADFDPYTLTFLKKKRIVFSDGCVSDFRKSHNYHGYRNVYYTPRTNNHSRDSNDDNNPPVDVTKWSTHQLLMWLRSVYNFYDDIYDNISAYKITGLQWSHLSTDALWQIGLNDVEISQVMTDRMNINHTITLHNMMNQIA